MERRAVKRWVARPRRASGLRQPEARDEPLLAGVVGHEIYAAWVEMLRAVVPHGRTHRLAVVVAGMLQYAVAVASDKPRPRAAASSPAATLLRSVDDVDPGTDECELGGHVDRLFRDAGVSAERVNARGEAYSITATAISEFVSWENMPWE